MNEVPSERRTDGDVSPNTRRQKDRPWWEKCRTRTRQAWRKTSWDRRVELLFAGAIVAFSFLQLRITVHNDNSTTAQVNQLITAANKIQAAAGKFAKSADGINLGVKNAVGKLNEQAVQLAGNVKQSTRLANETALANSNVVMADRPWLGADIRVTNFDVGKKPTVTAVFTNSGKRPAKIDVSAETSGFYTTFPFDPDTRYLPSGVRSTSILVPGQHTTLIANSNVYLKQNELDLASGLHPFRTFFAFAKVEYRDLRTNKSYYTHVCIFYLSAYKTATDSGFRNCQQYNEAD